MNSTQIKYTSLASETSIKKTIESLSKNGFIPTVADSEKEALAEIIKLIPEGSSINNGTSKTLQEIGFVDLLKAGDHSWENLHETILEEKDPKKQAHLRKLSTISDFYLGSAHALTENGEILIASNTGSQLPHLVFTSQNIILVVGAQKITKNLDDAFKRLNEVVIPQENERMMGVYGVGTTHAKTLILHKENPMMGRKIYVILVKESLGF